MNRSLIVVFALSMIIAGACQRTGEKAGEAVGDFIKGASSSVEEVFQLDVRLDKPLEGMGIKLGKIEMSSDTSGYDNLVSVYVIFEKDFADTLLARSFEGKDIESGRTKEYIKGKAGDAMYFDFRFDRRTELDAEDCYIILSKP